ncbi:MAG TPA: carboxylating nicotinate-nucleotide diphosphorylase [Thermodesulfobacteriota bacterium]|nr:carboxylating nicotinate-nucleotide diphosphorylase [Thermodesulfobacteriota bacterium]
MAETKRATKKKIPGRGVDRISPGLKRYVDIVVKTALVEDIGSGDVTTSAIVPSTMKGSCRIVAKERLVVAGLFIAENVFRRLDGSAVFTAGFRDGDRVKKGETIASVSGRLAALLAGERVALNFLQRLSGIATLTAEFVKRAGGRVKILDTRKTTPCLRSLERYAVRAGGGLNHRSGLYDSVLIKDNHIKAAGSVAEAISRVNKKYKGRVLVETEASTVEEAGEAASAGADIIMLDNMTPALIKKALKVIEEGALVEVSGGVTLSNVRSLAATGADFISIGALTHSAPAMDISMEVTAHEGKGSKRG